MEKQLMTMAKANFRRSENEWFSAEYLQKCLHASWLYLFYSAWKGYL